MDSRQLRHFVLVTLRNLTTRHDAYVSYTLRSTDAFLRQGRIEVSRDFLLHASGLSFGCQAWCMGSSCGRHATRTNSKDVDFRSVQLSNDVRKRGMEQEERSTTSIDQRAGEWVHDRSSEPFIGCTFWAFVDMVFPLLCWWTWGMVSRAFNTEEVDSSPIVLLEETPTTPRCRSGECSHNQLVNLSLSVLYFNFQFRCVALMH